MKAHFYHIQLNVSTKSLVFYRDLFAYLEYKVIDESEDYIGVSDGKTDFWIMKTEPKYETNNYHRKNTGINHIAFKVSSKVDVDTFCNEFLKPRNIPHLYDSPKLFPRYSPDYYAVYFEDPDRIKLEIVFNS
jgi:catechol 2,3-dioxygenase-like lactoylglutathione lyase family enzyme